MFLLLFGSVVILFAFGLNWIAGVVLSVILLLVLVLPVEGFRERESDVLSIIPLKRGTNDHAYYIEIISKNKVVFAYDNSDMYDLNGGAYEEDFRKGTIKIYESRNCNKPVLKSYVTRPNRECFTFAPFSTKKEYVFYIPEGSIWNLKDNRRSNTSDDVV